MTAYIGPALFALFVWWASTVAIIYLDNLPRSTFKWSMLGATIVFAVVALWRRAPRRRTPPRRAPIGPSPGGCWPGAGRR